MAHVSRIDTDREAITKSLVRSFQSGHLNFLLGSGASLPAIPIAGAAEQEITALLQADDIENAALRTFELIATVQDPTNLLIRDTARASNTTTKNHYMQFLRVLETLLSDRHSNLLPRKANLFTTNYDLFVEAAAATLPGLTLNDGFIRTTSLDGRMEFSTKSLFNVTFNSGNLYSYRVELPCINLIKLHGSLSWRKTANRIEFLIEAVDTNPPPATHPEVVTFLSRYCIVLPQPSKLGITVLESIYYELLRLYANELERENCLLVVFGFSFGDEHIRDITFRAMKNPTLRVVVVAYDDAAAAAYSTAFAAFRNVDIIGPETGGTIGFPQFIELLLNSIPRSKGAA